MRLVKSGSYQTDTKVFLRRRDKVPPFFCIDLWTIFHLHAERGAMITLYNVSVSNHGSKILVILTHKGLEWTETPPPDGYGSAAYKAIMPAGTVPAIGHDGMNLSDSAAIAAYLDEMFPAPPMLPDNPQKRAAAREIAHFHDSRIEPILRSYFSQISPANRDAALIATNATLLQTRLNDLAILAAPAPLMTGNNLGIADCGFVASFAIIALLQDVLDLPVRLPPSIADYASALAAHPSVMNEHARYQGALGAWADGKLCG